MKRRVIFPDPDVWTQRKDTTDMIQITAADFRRACALIVHHANQNTDGCNVVIAEINEQDRIAELIFAVLDLYQKLIPVLHTDIGQGVLKQLIIDMACREEGQSQ